MRKVISVKKNLWGNKWLIDHIESGERSTIKRTALGMDGDIRSWARDEGYTIDYSILTPGHPTFFVLRKIKRGWFK